MGKLNAVLDLDAVNSFWMPINVKPEIKHGKWKRMSRFYFTKRMGYRNIVSTVKLKLERDCSIVGVSILVSDALCFSSSSAFKTKAEKINKRDATQFAGECLRTVIVVAQAQSIIREDVMQRAQSGKGDSDDEAETDED